MKQEAIHLQPETIFKPRSRAEYQRHRRAQSVTLYFRTPDKAYAQVVTRALACLG